MEMVSITIEGNMTSTLPIGRTAPAPSGRLDRTAWESGLAAAASPAPLLQSWAWGEVQARSGWRVERLQLPGGGLASLLWQGLGPLRWGYVPRGPVPVSAEGLDALREWARERGLARLRVEPEAGPELGARLAAAGLRPGPELQPRLTRIVPLGPPEEMLAACRPKARYNIRLAE